MALLPDDPCQARDLILLASEPDAERSFLRLWTLMRDRLFRVALKFGLSEEDAEDAVQTVSSRLWERRSSLAEMSVGAFWALSFRSIKNLAIDQTRRRSKVQISPIEDLDLSPDDLPFVDTLVEALLEREQVFAAADRLWLGCLPRSSTAVLAVQLCLTEGLEPKAAAAMLGLDEDRVQEIVQDTLIARYAVCRALMWDNAELAGYVLCPENPPSSSALEDLLRRGLRGEGESVGSWSAWEAVVVVLYVRYGMPADEIRRLLPVHQTDVEIDQVIRKAATFFPFAQIGSTAAELLGSCLDEGLRPPGLWRRLVFEYHVRAQLPHRQILERTVPAASPLSVELKQTTLNSWIGNGRLWAQMASFVASEASL